MVSSTGGQILVCRRGRIVERGRHEEILARDGPCARLYHAQFETPFAADAIGA